MPVATRFEPFHVVSVFVTKPVVLRPTVPLVVMVPPVRPLLVATEVTVPLLEVRQTPLIEKQPPDKLNPFVAVDVAVTPVKLK